SFLIVAFVHLKTANTDAAAGAYIGAAVGFGIASAVGMPGQIPLVAVTFIAFAFVVVSQGPAAVTRNSAVRRRTWAGITAIVVGFVIATSVVAVRDLRPAFRALRSGWPYHYGFYPTEGAGESQFRWTTDRAVNVFP